MLELDVVLEHQALRGGHRGLRLVHVRALGEREQARDALDHARALVVLLRRLRNARGGRVDAPTLADLTERVSVRRLVLHLQDLVDVLVRHLVLEHLDDRAPRMREHERPRDLERARVAVPSPELMLRVRERQRGRGERVLEVRRVDASPFEQELAHEHALELGGEMFHPLI